MIHYKYDPSSKCFVHTIESPATFSIMPPSTCGSTSTVIESCSRLVPWWGSDETPEEALAPMIVRSNLMVVCEYCRTKNAGLVYSCPACGAPLP